MKQFFAILLLSATLVACNNAPIEGEGKEGGDGEKKDTVALAYTVPSKPDWQRGSEENVALAMNFLKAYETSNWDSLQQYLSDTVELHVDNFSFEGSRDSLLHLMKEERELYSNIRINMQDYESVKSKSRNQEWVSLWYTETTTMKNGQVDSFFIMDDVQIKNGKVYEIDSKMRRLPKQK